jgi:hypothetical protein
LVGLSLSSLAGIQGATDAIIQVHGSRFTLGQWFWKSNSEQQQQQQQQWQWHYQGES